MQTRSLRFVYTYLSPIHKEPQSRHSGLSENVGNNYEKEHEVVRELRWTVNFIGLLWTSCPEISSPVWADQICTLYFCRQTSFELMTVLQLFIGAAVLFPSGVRIWLCPAISSANAFNFAENAVPFPCLFICHQLFCFQAFFPRTSQITVNAPLADSGA